MRLTVTSEEGELYNLEFDNSMEVNDMKAIIASEFKLPITNIQVYHNSKLIGGSGSISQFGMVQDDVLLVRKLQTTSNSSTNRPSVGYNAINEAEALRQQLVGNPAMLNQLRTQNPQLAALALNNPEEFVRTVNRMQQQQLQSQNTNDYMNEDMQKKNRR